MTDRQIEVPLGERSYRIYVGAGIASSFATACQQHSIPNDVAIITDTNVARRYLKPVEKNLTQLGFRVLPIVIPPGENQKSLPRANAIFTALLKSGFGRKSGILALGGGVIGDLSGFVAATYHRGIPLVQVPTTLLAQVDSSIGGKTAVNHPLGKNMIGAFYQPRFVWVDIGYLRTLPEREVVCGIGEIVKYGIIRDAELFSYLEANLHRLLALEHDVILHVQERCSGIKAQLVSEDELETGVRVILNFGHTVGHALEAAGKFRVLKHGEAVLLGMIAESFMAKELGMISPEVYGRIAALIRRVPLRAKLASLKPREIFAMMGRDKKSVGGRKRFVLPTAIGDVTVVDSVEAGLIDSSLKQILKTAKK